MVELTIEANAAKSYECASLIYPYNNTFTVDVKEGKNELKFDTQVEADAFLMAATSDIMCGEIIIGEVADEVEETQETETKSSKKSKKKAEND